MSARKYVGRPDKKRSAKHRSIAVQTTRLDAFVVAAEKCDAGSKGRAAWYAKADRAREKLRKLEH